MMYKIKHRVVPLRPLTLLVLCCVQSPDFKAYFEANERWLRPYAVFKFLQGLFGTAEHWHWGSLSRPTQKVGNVL